VTENYKMLIHMSAVSPQLLRKATSSGLDHLWAQIQRSPKSSSSTH